MSILAGPIIAVFALALSLLCFVLLLILFSKYKTKLGVIETQSQANEILLNDLRSAHHLVQQQIDKFLEKSHQDTLENIQVSKQLEHRIKNLNKQLCDQQECISLLQTAQGEDKFYTRAIKLAKQGAEVDELITECELPQAEAEMLISVYRKK